MSLANDRFLRALRRQPVDRTPVWFMRQAGRYLPEYRATRAKAGDFMTLCRTPELACEVTLQPVERFDLDAAILFSDILTVPDAMGLGLHFVDGEGPRFRQPVRSAEDVARLPAPDPEQSLRYVTDAVRAARAALAGRVPLIGFSGSPWTLACYMIEGGSSAEFARVRAMVYEAPDLLDALIGKLTEAVTLYLAAQARAGAQALMLFDTWGGLLAPPALARHSVDPMAAIVRRLRKDAPDVPLIAFTKGAGAHLELLAQTGADALGLDWTSDLAAARKQVGGRVALQGNLDPCALLAPKAAIREEVARILAAFGQGPGHVFNLGHGVLQDTDPEHVAAMVAAVRALSPAYHAIRGAAPART